MKKANSISEVYNAIEGGRPLKVEEIDTFYRNADPARSRLSARGSLQKLSGGMP